MRLDFVVGPNGAGKTTFVRRVLMPVLPPGTVFVAETVFSHPSKLDLVARAQEAGFHVALHVLVVPEELSVRRVDYRVAAGGHSVPEDKIRQRYRRLWPLVVQAASLSNQATVYDNSSHPGPRVLARLYNGIPIGAVQWPAHTPTELRSAWPATE